MTALVTRRLLVAWAVLLAVLACREGQEPPLLQGSSLADSADQVMFGARSLMTRDGVRQAELFADTAFWFDDNTRTEMRNVRVVFFTETGLRNAVLTSREGTYNMRTSTMEARGNVVVVGEDGRRLTTEQLRYNQNRSEISSDSAFTVTEPNRQLTGIGFVSDPNMNNVRCLRACAGTGAAVQVPAAQ